MTININSQLSDFKSNKINEISVNNLTVKDVLEYQKSGWLGRTIISVNLYFAKGCGLNDERLRQIGEVFSAYVNKNIRLTQPQEESLSSKNIQGVFIRKI